ncbi:MULTISPECIES: hypothetical protein [unclassified Wolbachia]|uniref:hypothetical protein n=1 Tax=unclassified Wolbachia TaxID=2640676 RepID=UPI003132CD78
MGFKNRLVGHLSQLYEHCNMVQCYNDVIPVLDTGIQKSLLVSKQTSMESS